jgi:TetR/AcrR family transcriptional repressor of nem operon
MRRSREAAARTREEIVEAAAALFRERGIDSVSIADVMAELRLTVGGFYKHFESKDALVAEAIELASRSVSTKSGSAEEAVRGYLSLAHRAQPGRGCPVAALCSDAGRQPASTRRAFTQAFERLLAQVAALFPHSHQEQLHAVAAMVGGLVLSRATGDEKRAKELLDAVAEQLLARRVRKQSSRSKRG